MTLTPSIIHAAGADAANRNMRKENRTTWNETDYAICCDVINELYETLETKGN